MLEFAKLLIPPDENSSPRRLMGWRSVIGGLCLVFVLFMSFAFNGIPWTGVNGFALADEVDDKIEEAQRAIYDRLESIDEEQTTQGDYLAHLVKSDYAERINREIRARCEAESAEARRRATDAIEYWQQQYEEVDGTRYREPGCDEL